MKKLGDTPIGTCADCELPFSVAEEYILRNRVWFSVAKANERLHRKCFEKRLGRKLTDADYVARCYAEGEQVKVEVLDLTTYKKEQPRK